VKKEMNSKWIELESIFRENYESNYVFDNEINKILVQKSENLYLIRIGHSNKVETIHYSIITYKTREKRLTHDKLKSLYKSLNDFIYKLMRENIEGR
jgi:hypothetical protein